MTTGGEPATTDRHQTLVGRRVKLRPGRPEDALQLHAILAEQSVARWWASRIRSP
jgi:hypothetical protein